MSSLFYLTFSKLKGTVRKSVPQYHLRSGDDFYGAFLRRYGGYGICQFQYL